MLLEPNVVKGQLSGSETYVHVGSWRSAQVAAYADRQKAVQTRSLGVVRTTMITRGMRAQPFDELRTAFVAIGALRQAQGTLTTGSGHIEDRLGAPAERAPVMISP